MPLLPRLLFLAAAFIALAVPAGQVCAAGDPSGVWAIRAGGRVLGLVTVVRAAAGPTGWSVDLDRPAGTVFTSSHVARGMTAVREHRRLRSVGVSGDSLLLKYVDPKVGQADDVIVFTPLADGFAAWGFKDAPIEPILLTRAQVAETVDSGWIKDRDYPLDEPWPSNPEMTRMFEEDQGARQGAHIDWDVVSAQDSARRVRTRALLDAGQLHSGDDYERAAFIFQHGDKPQDYLLAHGLAIIAAAKGRRDATWIAAATLDRYLQSVGQKQVYGTQYHMRPGTPTTQEPYDRGVISDAMRVATGVPTQASQERQRAGYDAQAAAAPPPAPPKP